MKLEEGITFWNKMAATYDEHQYNDNYKRLIQRIARDVGAADRVLDVATGTGIVALAIAQNASTIEAIDYSPEMIGAAQEKATRTATSNVSFAVQGADRLDFPDGVFDAVVICNGLHVMEAPEKALPEARRVLKSKGLLVAPTPCCGETSEASARARQMIAERGFPIRTMFTAEGFRDLVESSSFAVLERDRMPYRMPLEYILARPANGK